MTALVWFTRDLRVHDHPALAAALGHGGRVVPLIDGDEANNNGNWQWIASVGTDPQPAFRRMYSPARQQERLDPQGDYVRRRVPELARYAEAPPR